MKKILPFMILSGLIAAAPAHAFNPQPDPPGFGLIGITPNETLRLNVSNITEAGPRFLPPDPCKVELSFVDGTGAVLLPAVQTTLAPGQSTSVDLNGASLFGSITTNGITSDSVLLRKEARPVIQILPNTNSDGRPNVLPPGPCVSTIELIDNQTGRTFMTSGPQKPGSIYEFNPQPDPPGDIVGFNPQPDPPGDIVGFNPQPDPPGDITFGLVSIVAGQTLRLTATHVVASDRALTPPDPCVVTLTFLDGEGKMVNSSTTTINFGASTFLDLPFPTTADATTVTAPASQMQLRGLVTIKRTSRFEPPDPCIVSVEVFDQATGRTSVLLSPQRVPLFTPSDSSD